MYVDRCPAVRPSVRHAPCNALSRQWESGEKSVGMALEIVLRGVFDGAELDFDGFSTQLGVCGIGTMHRGIFGFVTGVLMPRGASCGCQRLWRLTRTTLFSRTGLQRIRIAPDKDLYGFIRSNKDSMRIYMHLQGILRISI